MDKNTHDENVFTGITLEAILRPENMLEALKRVERNKGASGVDGMETEEIREYIRRNPGKLSKELLEGKYKPQPVRRQTIPKQEVGKFRNLGIPTVIDRMVQQAIAQVMSYYYDKTFSNSSYGYRPKRNAHDAVIAVVSYADEGYQWAVEIDLEKFFDTVNQSRLVSKLYKRIKDTRVISLIHKMLQAGVKTSEGIERTDIGLMQGGNLSPLLANIVLDELDKELEKRGLRFARYADDVIILCRSPRAAERVLGTITRFIESKLKLKVNQNKSGVNHITNRVKFLGYGFYTNTKIRRTIPTIHDKSKERFKESIRETLRRSQGRSLECTKIELRQKVTGWANYFKLANYDRWMRRADEWIRRRIRQLYWKVWKKIGTKFKALIKLGIPRQKAWKWVNTRKSYWRIANSHILTLSLTNEMLEQLNWTWIKKVHKPIGWS